MEDIFSDPHYRARHSIVAAPDDELGTVTMAAVVPRLSETPGTIVHSGHRIGQDTRPILRELLGFDDARIDALAASRVIRCDPYADGADARVPAEYDEPGVG